MNRSDLRHDPAGELTSAVNSGGVGPHDATSYLTDKVVLVDGSRYPA
jgi:hypothetical protein